MDLTISIATYDSKDITLECLNSIFQFTDGLDFEVVVIDNASTDGTYEAILKNFPQVKLIKNQINLGFAKAHNLAFRIAKGRYFVVLNSDIKIADNVFYHLKNYMDSHPEICLIAPKVLNSEGITQDILRYYPGLKETIIGGLISLGLIDKEKFYKFSTRNFNYNETYIVKNEYIMGCCYFIRKSVINETFLFDENFSLVYSEDADLCYRLIKRGCKILYYPKVSIYHYGGYTANKKKISDIIFYKQIRISFWRNKFYYIRKHKSKFEELLLRLIVSLSFLIFIFVNFSMYLLTRTEKYKFKVNIGLSIFRLSIGLN